MKKKEFKKSEIIIFIFISSFLILVLPHIVRYFFFDNILIGEESYYHARIASEINNKGMPVFDRLSYNGINYIFNPYHSFLAFFSSFLGVELASKLVPLVLGIISIFLFYYILKELRFNFERRFLSTIILLLSPPFIYTFVVSTSYSFLIFLVLSSFAIFINKNNYLFPVSLLLLLIIPLFGFFHVFVIVFLLLSYMFYRKSAINRFFIGLIFLMFSSLYYYGTIYNKFFRTETFLSRNVFKDLISGLGSQQGLSIFAILLALVGIIVLWKYKKNFYPIYMNSLLLIAAFLYRGANIYLSIFLSIFAGLGFYRLMKMRWEAKIIKNLTLWLFVIGLVFSSALYIARLVNFEPNKDIIQSLEWLKENPQDLVFSHYSKGFWIEDKAKMPVFMDSLFTHTMNANERYNISNNIFYSQDLRKTRSLLKENKIKYIWIDEKMKYNQVWKEEQQGLLFLFKNNETFKNIYANSEVEIWRVLS